MYLDVYTTKEKQEHSFIYGYNPIDSISQYKNSFMDFLYIHWIYLLHMYNNRKDLNFWYFFLFVLIHLVLVTDFYILGRKKNWRNSFNHESNSNQKVFIVVIWLWFAIITFVYCYSLCALILLATILFGDKDRFSL